VRERGGLAAARRSPEAALMRARDVLAGARARLLREVVVHRRLEPAALEAAHQAALTLFEREVNADDPREPLALEYEFGDKPTAMAPPLAVAAPGDPTRVLKVRGKVDRIDRVGARVEAIDYKRTPQSYPEGRHFQIPVYLAVAARDFGRGATEVAGFWLGFRDGKRPAAVAPVAPADFAAALARDLHTRADRVLAGDVSPDPAKPGVCARCDFASLCRYCASAVGEDER